MLNTRSTPKAPAKSREKRKTFPLRLSATLVGELQQYAKIREESLNKVLVRRILDSAELRAHMAGS